MVSGCELLYVNNGRCDEYLIDDNFLWCDRYSVDELIYGCCENIRGDKFMVTIILYVVKNIYLAIMFYLNIIFCLVIALYLMIAFYFVIVFYVEVVFCLVMALYLMIAFYFVIAFYVEVVFCSVINL